MRTELVKIIENLLTGDRTKALDYAELLVKNCERKYEQTKDIFDKYEIMGARNIVHMMKGEPKEGGTVVLDDCPGRKYQTAGDADKPSRPKTVRDLLKRLDDSADQLNRTAFNNATEDSLRVTLHNFILKVWDYAHEIEAAHGREVAELETKLANTETARKFFAIRLVSAKEKVEELRQCLKEAMEVACDGCRFAVWRNQKFVKCKKHSNWRCPFGTERWRKALRGDVK